MKKYRLLPMFMAVVMGSVLAVGCGNSRHRENDADEKTVSSEEKTDSEEMTDSEELQSSNDIIKDGLKVKKIGSIETDIFITGDNGLIYRDDNGKYGIITLDGKKDTGAKYTACKSIGNYFLVRTDDGGNVENPASMNCMGVVDVTGKEIIPMKYASANEISDRYIYVCEVTEQTTDKQEALVYSSDSAFSINYSDGDILFKGKWYIYDMVSGKMLDGVSGTNSCNINVYGNFIRYETDTGKKITVNEKGEKLSEDADLFMNGYYALVKENAGAVYNSEHEKMFDYEIDSFVPCDSTDEYIVASLYENGETKYVIMDTAGKVVSAEFSDRPDVYGKLVKAGEKIYDFEGNMVIEGTFQVVHYEKQFGDVWFLKNDKEWTMIDKDGTVLYQGIEDDVTSVYTDRYSIEKKVDDKRMYYSFADKDFVIEGSSCAPWLVSVSRPNRIYDMVDVISGKSIISGYNSYSNVVTSDGTIYVYALKAGGGHDIYTVTK